MRINDGGNTLGWTNNAGIAEVENGWYRLSEIERPIRGGKEEVEVDVSDEKEKVSAIDDASRVHIYRQIKWVCGRVEFSCLLPANPSCLPVYVNSG